MDPKEMLTTLQSEVQRINKSRLLMIEEIDRLAEQILDMQNRLLAVVREAKTIYAEYVEFKHQISTEEQTVAEDLLDAIETTLASPGGASSTSDPLDASGLGNVSGTQSLLPDPDGAPIGSEL